MTGLVDPCGIQTASPEKGVEEPLTCQRPFLRSRLSYFTAAIAWAAKISPRNIDITAIAVAFITHALREFLHGGYDVGFRDLDPFQAHQLQDCLYGKHS